MSTDCADYLCPMQMFAIAFCQRSSNHQVGKTPYSVDVSWLLLPAIPVLARWGHEKQWVKTAWAQQVGFLLTKAALATAAAERLV